MTGEQKRVPSIHDQIEAMRQLVDRRVIVLEGLISKGRMKQATADWEVDCLNRAMSTLSFLRENGDEIRGYFQAKKTFLNDRAREMAFANGEVLDAPDGTQGADGAASGEGGV